MTLRVVTAAYAARFGAVCECVERHGPPALELHEHHVQPLYLGGPDEAWNRVVVCPNTHYTSHLLLRALVKGNGVWSWSVARSAGPYARMLARVGWERYAASVPPAGVLRPIWAATRLPPWEVGAGRYTPSPLPDVAA